LNKNIKEEIELTEEEIEAKKQRKDKFYKDLNQIYTYLTYRNRQLNTYYSYLEKKEYEKLDIIDSFIDSLELEINDSSRLALITRLVSLRDDLLVQELKKSDFSEDEIIHKKEEAYLWVASFYLDRHKELVDYIDFNDLLTPLYRKIFEGVHIVGKVVSSWQSSWTAEIINGVNRDLYTLFNGDEDKIFDMLNEKNLIDLGHDSQKGDRCYSVLVKNSSGVYESRAYCEVFDEETNKIISELKKFRRSIQYIEDDIFDMTQNYVEYINRLITAFAETDKDLLVRRWANVDRAWMDIDTPIQIGHPLEYYEDHYRKAVALEWDLRIINPKTANSTRVDSIKSMYKTLFDSIEKPIQNDYDYTYEFSLKSLNKVQLYIGRPALFYGAEFCGMFSAQVVPNDERVSFDRGKKIFAFADEILQNSRSKPFMLLSSEIFGEKFIKEDRRFLFNETSKWHLCYDVSTIGHEYGHILWISRLTEQKMNESGNFKNIEEFKATTGGLVAFFLNPHDNLEIHILNDLIKRAVSLIAWMEVDEVKPYYCEGLIHLVGLFESEVLSFYGEKLSIDNSIDGYNKVKEWYLKTYKELAVEYLNMSDASNFLYRFLEKGELNFMPKDSKIREFVEFYYSRYKEIGTQIDDSDSKENYTQVF
jgi:hypothetical protein